MLQMNMAGFFSHSTTMLGYLTQYIKASSCCALMRPFQSAISAEGGDAAGRFLGWP